MVSPQVPLLVPAGSWQLEVEASPAGPQEIHELTHVVQQGGGIKVVESQGRTLGMHFPQRKGSEVLVPAQAHNHRPHTDDEVLVLFEHGDVRNAGLFLGLANQPGATRLKIPSFRTGPGKIRALRVRVREGGSEPLRLFLATARDQGIQQVLQKVQLF